MALRRTSSAKRYLFNTTKHPPSPSPLVTQQHSPSFPPNPPPKSLNPKNSTGSFRVEDVRKVMRRWQMEKVKKKLREIEMNTITYGEYMRVCREESDDHEFGGEIAKMLHHSADVIVLSTVVFLRPHQVAKSMEKLIYEAIAKPNDPRRKELEEMEKKKNMIDKKAESMVKAELYFGLGFLALQTLGFMRLTFWEFSWDVMEPICFFTASLHFGLAYGFFLRTSKEPSFEGYFQRRFRVRQTKLMKQHNFDIDKYNQLSLAFYSMGYDPKGPTSMPISVNS